MFNLTLENYLWTNGFGKAYFTQCRPEVKKQLLQIAGPSRRSSSLQSKNQTTASTTSTSEPQEED